MPFWGFWCNRFLTLPGPRFFTRQRPQYRQVCHIFVQVSRLGRFQAPGETSKTLVVDYMPESFLPDFALANMGVAINART
jgi:hypothetical protein